MTMKRRLLWFAIVAVLVACALWALPWAREQIRIDTCLDRGGVWDYAAERCET